MISLNGKVILITGAAGGFGRELTRQLLHEGAMLILTDREQAALHQTASEVASALASQSVQGKILAYLPADLATAEGCDMLAEQVQTLAPQIDMLVNNAGIGLSGNFHETPREKWERLMQVNLLAPMRLTWALLPGMIERRGGYVLNISSCAGLVGTPMLAAYSTSKFGLRGFGEALANELEPYGIAVTTVYPFFARTPILNSEQFGSNRPAPLPDAMIDDPAAVIAEAIDGVKHGKRHVYPGATAKRIYNIQRFGPWAAPFVTRMLARFS